MYFESDNSISRCKKKRLKQALHVVYIDQYSKLQMKKAGEKPLKKSEDPNRKTLKHPYSFPDGK